MIIKRRAKASEIEAMDLVGSVQGKDCIIVDDIIDTGGTLIKAAELLKSNGAKKVVAYATHGLFSGAAFEKIKKDTALDAIVITNSVPLKKDAP